MPAVARHFQHYVCVSHPVPTSKHCIRLLRVEHGSCYNVSCDAACWAGGQLAVLLMLVQPVGQLWGCRHKRADFSCQCWSVFICFCSTVDADP
jgi:hypothetical protein